MTNEGVVSASASRQAALLIHGLPATARELVLSRLSDVERGQVAPLLDELAALGIPRDLPASAAEPSAAPVDPALLIAVARPEHVLAALGPCSALTVARVFDLAEWPWATQVLGAMEPARRSRVVALRGVRVAPGVSRSLMASFTAALGALPRSAAEPPSGWRRMWSWTR